MSVPLFKDYRAEASSALTSMFSGSGKWKVEGRNGSSKEEYVTLSPSASNDGLSLNLEAKSSLSPVVLKITSGIEKRIRKISANWKHDNHKFDLSLDPGKKLSSSATWISRVSLSHTCAGKLFSYSDSINRKGIEGSLSVKVTDNLFLGMSANVDFKGIGLDSPAEDMSNEAADTTASPPTQSASDPPVLKAKKSKSKSKQKSSKLPLGPLDFLTIDFGGRLRRGARTVDMQVCDNLSIFSVGLSTPIGKKISFATEVKYRAKEHMKAHYAVRDIGALAGIVTLSAVFSMPCPFFAKNTIKARVSEDHRVSLCYVWQQKALMSAITVNDKGKFGVQFVVSGDSFSSSSTGKHRSSKDKSEKEGTKVARSSTPPPKSVTL